MASTSNIYAEKIFSEHPTQLWALDEKVDFVSYLNSSEKSLNAWTQTGGTVLIETSPPTPLPISETSYKITNSTTVCTITSVAKFISGSTVSFYFNPTSPLLTSIDIVVGSESTQSITITSDMVNTWSFISKTFSDMTSANSTLKITFNYSAATANTTYINGLSWGYDSENFNVSSTGIVPASLPSNITYGNTYAWTGTANASTSIKILNGWSTPNLITNPDFETSANDWLANSITVLRDTSQYFIGSASLKLTINGTDPYAVNIPGGISNSRISVVPGKAYTFSYYIKNGTSTTQWSAQLKGYTTPSFTYGPVMAYDGPLTTISTTQWTRLFVTWTIPEGVTYVEARVATTADTSSSTVYIDAVLLEESPVLNSYVNPNIIRTNLITNPSFETNATGWSFFGTSSQGFYSGGAFSGSNSLYLSAIGLSRIGPSSNITTVIAGLNYTSSIYVKDINTSIKYQAAIQWKNSGGTIISTDSGVSTSVTTSGWTRISVTATAPSLTTSATVTFYSTTSATSGKQVLFDGALFEQSSLLDNYFDGSFSYSLYQTPAYSYGKQNLISNTAYYLMDTSKLYAKNTSIPMAYGGNSTTLINPNYSSVLLETYPSLIIPGQGFMNESGKNKDLTFECWFKIGSTSTIARRIFGPIGSTDGLYVDGPFFRLKIGNSFASKYIGEWARPMLIQIYIGFNIVKMFLNGEEVISFNIDTNATTFSLENQYGKDNTFLGFFAYSDIPNIEIDGIAIYPYAVNSVLAMRRWVYGQAVEFKQNINYLYNGKTAITDYAFSNYSNNYNYPKISKWNTGTFQNIKIENDTLSSPDYSLPDYYVGSELKTLTLNAADSVGAFIRVDTNGKLIFSSINQLKVNTRSVYGIFKRIESSTSDQILFYIINNDTQEYFKVFINQSTLYYNVKLNSSLSETNLYSVATTSETFVAGFDIEKLISNSSENISNLFSNLNNLKLYVGGSPTENSFSGNIYKIGFASTYDTSLILNYFNDSNGIINSSLDSDITYDADSYNTSSWTNTFDAGTYSTNSWDSTVSASALEGLLSYTPSYLLTVSTILNSLCLEIQSNSYWQESIPLSRFAKYVKNTDSVNVYEIDFIQLNIDYPEPSVPLTGSTNTSNSLVKTYVYFQKINGTNEIDINSVISTQSLNNECVVVPDTNWKTTRYEVVNGTIIYLPNNFDTGKDFSNYAITVGVIISNPGILNNPIQIRSLELASKSLDYLKPNPISTKFGKDLVPYNDSTGTRNYKNKNPVRIYKKSSPHLYLTKHSGMKLSGNDSFGSNGTRGYYMDASTNSLDIDGHDQNIGSIQIVLRWNYETFPSQETEIFRINSTLGVIKFYLSASSTFLNRRKIIARLNNLEYTSSLKYYWNGLEVLNPIIKPNEWGIFGISFLKGIGIDNLSSINITGNILVNNISYYKLTDLQLGQKKYVENSWNSITGSAWSATSTATSTFDGTWANVFSKLVNYLPDVNGSEIYNSYVGSNKNNLVNESTSNKVLLNKAQYSVYTGISNKPIDFDIA